MARNIASNWPPGGFRVATSFGILAVSNWTLATFYSLDYLRYCYISITIYKVLKIK